MRIVCSDEAQKRLTVVPGTVSGSPASSADAPGEVHALLLLREAAADHHVVDLARRQRRHLLERGLDGERGEVVGAGVDERALGGAADRRARGGDDHGFWHAPILTDGSNAG